MYPVLARVYKLHVCINRTLFRQQPCPFANYCKNRWPAVTEISVSTRTEIASSLDMLGRPVPSLSSVSVPHSQTLRRVLTLCSRFMSPAYTSINLRRVLIGGPFLGNRSRMTQLTSRLYYAVSSTLIVKFGRWIASLWPLVARSVASILYLNCISYRQITCLTSPKVTG
jgi:hypothetical protein